MNLFRTIAISLVLLLSSFEASAAVSFRFRKFYVEDGLPSNTVRSIVQDNLGRMWFGTGESLCCFDGTEMRRFRISNGEEGEYGDNYINALYEDSKGRLWLGTDIGIFIYDYQTNVFTRFKVETKDGEKISSIINNIVEDKDHNIWCSTYGQGVFRYNIETSLLNNFSKEKNLDSRVDYVFVDSENNVWTVDRHDDAALARLDKAKDSFEHVKINYPTPETRSSYLVIFEDSGGVLWLGSWDTGLHKYDKLTGDITAYLFDIDDKSHDIKHIHYIEEYLPNILLVGSDDGLTSFNTLTRETHTFVPDESDMTSISDKFIYPIVKDREGGLWVGTYYGGVNYVSPNSGQFEGNSCAQFTKSGRGNIVSHFCEGEDGSIWIATDDKGLLCYSPRDNQAVHYMPEAGKNSLSYKNIHALCFDNEDLWIGTYSGGLNVLDTKTGLYKHYYSVKDDSTTIDQSSIYAIYKDRSDTMWVATMAGINKYNRSEDNFIRVLNTGYTTIDIDQDSEGYIWFSSMGGGLYRYNPIDGQWKNYLHTSDEGSLPSNQMNCICIDSEANMWIGTGDGLCLYDSRTDTFKSISIDLPSNDITSILEDNHVLWLSTARGIVRYTPDGKVIMFTKSDGLQSDQFLPNSGLKTSSGKLYFGSVNGFNSFYPYLIKTNQYVPPIIITSLELFNKEYGLEKTLPYTEEVRLSHRDNMISLKYAALSYSTPSKNQYAYILEGFDKEWNYVDNQTKAFYTNIPIGTYIFRVKASNNDGVWNEEGASLKIVILPPLLLTLPFKILYILLLIAALILFIRFFLRRSEKLHRKNIDKINMDKEKEVYDAKIQFFTTIAHEIRTPVSLIIAPLEKIKSSPGEIPQEIKEDLAVMDRNSHRLLSLVNELLDFRKMENGKGVSLKFTPTDISTLLTNVSERFRLPLSQQGITFTTSLPEEKFEADVDYEAITKVVSNLLANAKKYTKNRIDLICCLDKQKRFFEIKVRDNGAGIRNEEKEKIFRPFYQASSDTTEKQGTGLGLSIVKNVVEAHHGKVVIESAVNEGSTFIVTLPLSQSLKEKPTDILSESNTPYYQNEKPYMIIAEDNEELLRFLSDSFSDEYSVLTAKDGVEAAQYLDQHEVAMIISDWMMPRMDGAEFCRMIRANQSYSHIPFILLTAKVDIDSKIESMDIGADAYIEKPFSMHYLKACIKNLIELRKMLMQKFSKMPLVPLNSVAGNSSDEKFLFQMNTLIEHNFSNPDLSVNFLAEELCISRSGLFAKIKTLTDITPNELIQIVRLKKGAELLLENKYMVSEISYMVGFNNPSYFAKCFQKQFGVKPLEFIHSHIKNPQQ